MSATDQSNTDPLKKLSLCPPESPEALAIRFERERRALLDQKERQLESCAQTFRIGTVPYLNAAPLTRGLGESLVALPPTELARWLRDDRLDAGLISVTEPLMQDRYDILDGIAVASLGEVRSVFLAHKIPLEEIRLIHLDPASLTSVNLLKVLLAEHGWNPEFTTLDSYNKAGQNEATLLIGDPAIRFAADLPDGFETWDLGSAWYELTRLPFVYAVWALQRKPGLEGLKSQLKESKSFGLETLDRIIEESDEFTESFRRDYLSWHIHYHMGEDEKRGLAAFVNLLEKHNLGPIYNPRFVN